ncbi:LolA family protein [Rickettsiales endosymbiont of Stachyamoeba lipophora]|uniref:LolA family protein n=1 Tax=Rickettsiales endosymbiont of Stachyamoeba lipophora TaxID=2486578 RepID=UPI000F6464E4|nr:outer membrane lipoprotein carrier protein LolA [Rickettsiales endosymbiont of Stachyamoeba lipophora]AZL15249.1 outer membrane lipoprotein carrier protein LolA [Rickettsiales endosymbiont of Stachyamoeba lipophora]
MNKKILCFILLMACGLISFSVNAEKVKPLSQLDFGSQVQEEVYGTTEDHLSVYGVREDSSVGLQLTAELKSNKRFIDDFVEQVNQEDISTELGKQGGCNQCSEYTKVVNYLNSIKTLVADFIQIAPDGSSNEGQFFLSRPGKLRWHYHPPIPVLIIINGGFLIYYDYELNEATYTNVDEVMGSFLTAKVIDFKDDNIRTEHVKKYGLLKFIVTKNKLSKNKQGFKKITLVFTEAPFELKKLEFTDQNNQQTSVSFHNMKFNVAVDNKLFTFKNPTIIKKQ